MASQNIQIEYGSERHLEVIEALNAGGKPVELASQFMMSADTIRKIRRTVKKFETFPIALTDGQTKVAVANVTTARGFSYACRHVVRKFSGTFSNLELPQWRLVSGDYQEKLIDIRSGDSQMEHAA